MGKKSGITSANLPSSSCRVCRGMGSVEMTAHFATGDADFEWPCWECYGEDARGTFPTPGSSTEM